MATPQLSDVAGGATFTVAVQALPDWLKVTVAPHVIVGLVLSTTVTLKTQVLVLPAASVAVTVTVVVPTANCDPDGGLDTTVGAPLL